VQIKMEKIFVEDGVNSPNQKLLNEEQWIELFQKEELIQKYKKKIKKIRKSINVTFFIFNSVFLGKKGLKEDFSFESKI
jgi:uncharacterized linocin/CFP29 family protein